VFSFLIYLCFNVVVTHYFFYFKLDNGETTSLFYSYFIFKYVLNYLNYDMSSQLNILNNNVLFNKTEGLNYPHTVSSTPQKTLINFIV